MATKSDILTEIYKVRNQINEVEGKALVDLNDKQIKIRIENEAYNGKKYLFEDELARVKKVLVHVKLEKEVDEFYRTKKGIEFKTTTEDLINDNLKTWEETEQVVKDKIIKLIQFSLGHHWGIERFHTKHLTISVIDQEKSTPDRLQFYFAQSIELRYEANSWMKGGKESFEASFGSTGSFSVEGNNIGDRALYYVGIGKLFENKLLIQLLKETMRDTSSKMDSLYEELKELRKRLENPFEYINA